MNKATQNDPQGKFIFMPSYSPKNTPANSNGPCAINSTFDITPAKDGLKMAIRACQDLQVETGLNQGVDRWTALLERLPAYQVNEDCALTEWSWTGLEDRYSHRHISHLYPVWPSFEANPEGNPDLLEACKRAIEIRGVEKTERWCLMTFSEFFL